MLDIVSTDTHIRTYTRFFFLVFFYLNNHGLIPVLFITTTIWKSLFAFFSNFESNSRSLSTEYLSLCEHANVGVSLRSFLYCRIIIGRVLKWHFHDGKNGKYYQLLFAAKMGTQTQVSHSQSQTHARTHFAKNTRIDLQTHFSSEVPGIWPAYIKCFDNSFLLSFFRSLKALLLPLSPSLFLSVAPICGTVHENLSNWENLCSEFFSLLAFYLSCCHLKNINNNTA